MSYQFLVLLTITNGAVVFREIIVEDGRDDQGCNRQSE
jgi:hypothetical protein